MHHVKQSLVCAAVALLLIGCGSPRKAVAPPPRTPKPPAAPQAAAPAATSAVTQPGKHVLFDGKTLKGWTSTDFAGRGEVTVKDGQINLGNGYMTGVTWTSAVPKMNYEISLDAKRVEGSDFFCGLTFPIGNQSASFIVGGWGGGTIGISSIDGNDASQNETTGAMNFTTGKWYHIRVRVVPGHIDAWIDDEQVVKLDTADKTFATRIEVEASKPLGIATWSTAAALKNVQLTTLE
jgi:hypothetical protein